VTLFLIHPGGYAQNISNMKSLLSEQGQVLFGDEPNSMLIVDYPENIERVEEYLQMVDVAPQQVHIEARVAEVKLQGETSLGIDWTMFATTGGWNFGNFDMYSGTAASGITTAGVIDYDTYSKIKEPPISGATTSTDPFTLTLAHNNIDVVMRALANDYDTDILSAPSVTTINNHEAIIQMTDIYPWAEPTVTTVEGSSPEISYEVKFEEAGITLKVTPTISENGQIVMDLQPEISEKTDDYAITIDPGGGAQTITYTIPIIETRQAKTKVVVGSGDTLIIGGLIKNKEIESEIKIPLLGDIPYLGYLFKSSRKTMDKRELVIFVSPTIIRAPEIEYSGKLEKKIRKNLEGSESKLEITPMKEITPKKKAKEEAKAAAEKAEAEAAAAQERKKEEALERRINTLYAQGVTAYSDGKLKQARMYFKRALRYDPTHKGTLKFLGTTIPQAIKEEKARTREGSAQLKAKEEEALAVKKIKVEPVPEPEDEVDLKQMAQEEAERKKEQERLIRKEKRRQEAERKNQETEIRRQEAERKKQEAEARRIEAKRKRQEARAQREAEKKQKALEKQKKRQAAKEEARLKREVELKIKRLYSEALALYVKKEYLSAKAKFEELQELSPGYSRSEHYLTKIPQLIAAAEEARKAQEVKQNKLAIETQAKEAYEIAVSLYRVKKYQEAYDKFQAVQKIISGYKETIYYLNKIPEILKRKQRADQLRFQKDREQSIKEMLNSCE